MQVKRERSDWRDRALSRRHRRWGWNCPAMDIDFLEFHHGEPVALIECKLEHADPWDLTSLSARALIRLADRAALPAFYVVRAEDFSWWRVRALNALACRYLAAEVETRTEPEFVSLLYALRGLNLPPQTAARSYCQEEQS